MIDSRNLAAVGKVSWLRHIFHEENAIKSPITKLGRFAKSTCREEDP